MATSPAPMGGVGGALDALLRDWSAATAPVDARRAAEASLSRQEDALLGKRAGKRATSGEDAAACRPFDHAAFLARVSTFRIATWFAKPCAINPFVCARYGWRNIKPDLLYCPCCEQYLCFTIDAKLSEAGVAKIAKVFAVQLETGHTPLCPWRGNPSPIEFTTLPLGTKLGVWESFAARFQEDIKWVQSHQSWTGKILRRLHVSDSVKTKLLERLCGSSDTEADASRFVKRLVARLLPKASDPIERSTPAADYDDEDAIALLLCLLIVSGWEFDETQGASHSVAWCSSCNRRWCLLPGVKSEEGDDEAPAKTESDAADEPARKRAKKEDAPPADLLAQHRPFCPWVHGQSAADDHDEQLVLPAFSRLPGWEQHCQAISTFLHEKNDSVPCADTTQHCNPEESLHSIRSILDL